MSRLAALVIALALAAGCLVVVTRPRTPGARTMGPAAAAVAFQQGIEAADLRVSIDACPYVSADAIRAWRAGYRWAEGK